ncbi:hypothetical protein [Novosphingobium lindaniclasticum]|uniref:Uncharacterized protein n=1 Tax=Novosphingobium lindaniclasticum LE124 TaxID=1096930 RepID=T0HI32_9SPHN|nr:hypothetical protein [Novosphingobium lindaniclasticum]EQB12682.1 hypothetical protein L284_15015 [Novosphingobium lindaniclasticum LE124]
MSRAGSDIMDMLHSLVATGLTEELERAISAAADPDPAKRVPINPQLIDKALKFLKDNGIDAPRANKKVDTLAGVLTDLDLDAEASALRMN